MKTQDKTGVPFLLCKVKNVLNVCELTHFMCNRHEYDISSLVNGMAETISFLNISPKLLHQYGLQKTIRKEDKLISLKKDVNGPVMQVRRQMQSTHTSMNKGMHFNL